MNTEIKIDDTKSVWVAWTNTDIRDGRGSKVPLAVCEEEVTARRLGKGNGVQGVDCSVVETKAFRIGRYWYAPSRIITPTREDYIEKYKNK